MNNPLAFLADSPRHLFFTGKGGVGKTSIACACACALADAGKRVLLVSTDPASNLQHVFDCTIDAHEPTPIADVPNLHALNLDPGAAAKGYRDRVIAPVRDLLPAATIREMEEQLSGACTTEIAAFDEFTSLLTDTQTTAHYDHVIFDTAPTGHTLRLLSLPNAWSGFLDTNTSGTSCLGPLAGLKRQHAQYRTAVATLADAEATVLVLVSRAQQTSLREAARTGAELAALGIRHQQLIVNGIMPMCEHSDDPLARALVAQEQDAIARMPATLQALPVGQIPLQPHNLIGVDALRALTHPPASCSGLEPDNAAAPAAAARKLPPLAGLIDALEGDGHGLIMVMGKGGVGKTTVAAAVAVELARRGHAVDLTTTDPAAHLAAAVDREVSNVSLSRIDPAVETARYRRHIMETQGRDLDDAGRKLLEEDLRSPCTEEIAVFQAFASAIELADRRFVVMDTAPTGHTLLLLDATGAYHREIRRHHESDGGHAATPLMRLQNPAITKMLLVTLPETTPILEAAALQEDLRRAGIEPWAWIVNASLAAAGVRDPLLYARADAEAPRIADVANVHATRAALVPMLAVEPTGPENLQQLVNPIPSEDPV